MRLIQDLSDYMNVILTTLIVLLLVVIAIVYYLLKIKKIATEEEILDYTRFDRKDATEYSKFDDIIATGNGNDKNAPGMITLGGNTFIGGIEVSGYNYHSASAEERERTMINTIAFFNIVDAPIQLRQTVKAIDIHRTIEEEKECARRLEKELITLDRQLHEAAYALEENEDNDDVYDYIMKTCDKLKRTIRSKQWQLSESKEMVYYMETISDASVNMTKINQIMFTYYYNPAEDLTELTEEEVLLKAQKEIMNMGQIYGGALENCGCSWRPLSADDLTDLLRRHYHPNTADDMRLEELLNSSYTSLYVTSDSLEELERERRGDLEYERQMAKMLEEQRAQRVEIEKRLEEERQKMYEKAENVAG